MPEFELGLNGPTLVLAGLVGLSSVTVGPWLRHRAPWLFRTLLFLALSAGMSVAYLTYLQRRAGLGDGSLADPTELIEKAKGVQRQSQRRNREIQRALRSLEQERRRGRPARDQEQ